MEGTKNGFRTGGEGKSEDARKMREKSTWLVKRSSKSWGNAVGKERVYKRKGSDAAGGGEGGRVFREATNEEHVTTVVH